MLSDTDRATSKAYGVLYDDPKDSVFFRRAKRSWFVIDKAGIIRYALTTGWREFVKNDEVLKVLKRISEIEKLEGEVMAFATSGNQNDVRSTKRGLGITS
ncbi:MAG: redoxin domain-containing protein [bacterium]|nr:redoxin domain-containing protein [bacterium]